MQRARIIGRAVSTAKHPSMQGFRILLAQPITGDDRIDGDPMLVLDTLGAGNGSTVIVSGDGKYAREMVGVKKTPVRFVTIGIEDG